MYVCSEIGLLIVFLLRLTVAASVCAARLCFRIASNAVNTRTRHSANLSKFVSEIKPSANAASTAAIKMGA